jgi:death-on-curing protein
MASLMHNHAFIDGNKRISFIAMATMLDLNGYDLKATQDERYVFVLVFSFFQTELFSMAKLV